MDGMALGIREDDNRRRARVAEYWGRMPTGLSSRRAEEFNRRDAWGSKRRKSPRGQNMQRRSWRQLSSVLAANNHERLTMLEQTLKRGGFRYRDFLTAINRKEALKLNSMVLWLKQEYPRFEEMVNADARSFNV